MTTAFERLGIAPTHDVRTIKRAYAVVLKTIDQASEREAFERLRQAYEQALAWAAQGEDADDDPAGEDEPDQGQGRDHEEDQDAPEDTPTRESEATAPPPPAPPSAESASAALSAEASRQALRHWTAQLRDAAPGTAAALLDAALADLRLLHLDSHAQLEARVASLLHDDPRGRAELFEAAALRFHWLERNARPIADMAAAHWISRVVDQGLQWRTQAPSAIARQQQALDTVKQVATPDTAQMRHFAELLAQMAVDHPDWFALHLDRQGHAHWAAWKALQSARASQGESPPEGAAPQLGANGKSGTSGANGMRGKWVNVLVGGFFMLLLLTAVISGVTKRLIGDRAPPMATAGESANADASASSATAEPVLAYEFTGAVTRDSCASTEEFVHASNWLQVDDDDAVALLATRAMRCQDKGFWSRQSDTLMACLRTERSTALGAGRPEDARRCTAPAPGGR